MRTERRASSKNIVMNSGSVASSGQIRFNTTRRRAPQPASIIASNTSAIPPRPI